MITYSDIRDIPIYENTLHIDTAGYSELVIFHKPVDSRGSEVVRVETFRYSRQCGGVFMNVSNTLSIEDARLEWASLVSFGYEKIDMHEFHHSEVNK